MSRLSTLSIAGHMSCVTVPAQSTVPVSATLWWGLECLDLKQDSHDGAPVERTHPSSRARAQCILCGRERNSSNTLQERWATAWRATWGWEGRGQGNSGLSGTQFLALSPEAGLSVWTDHCRSLHLIIGACLRRKPGDTAAFTVAASAAPHCGSLHLCLSHQPRV